MRKARRAERLSGDQHSRGRRDPGRGHEGRLQRGDLCVLPCRHPDRLRRGGHVPRGEQYPAQRGRSHPEPDVRRFNSAETDTSITQQRPRRGVAPPRRSYISGNGTETNGTETNFMLRRLEHLGPRPGQRPAPRTGCALDGAAGKGVFRTVRHSGGGAERAEHGL